MKVVFLNAPNKGIKVEPLNLEYLCTYLNVNGVSSIIIDATFDNLKDNKIKSLLQSYSPDFICLSMTTITIKQDTHGITLAKQACPDAKIIVGGPHPSAEPISLMKAFNEIDYVVVGEGEETLLELINKLEAGKNISGVLGICYRKNSKLILNNRRPLIQDLDKIPIPSREFIDLKKVRATIPFGRRKPFSIVMTARGCPYRCVFCSKSVFYNKYRYRSIENVIAELDYLQSLGVKEFRFYDDIFTLIPNRVKKICKEMINKKYDFIWSCEARVDNITEDLLSVMKQAGCYNITYGVESGSQKVLDQSKKDITVLQVKKAFELAKKVGLETSALFMMGLPGETKDTLKETLSLIKEINPDFTNVGLTVLFPQTELLDIAKKEGFVDRVDWYSFTSKKITPVIVGNTKQYIPPGVTKKELNDALKKFYISYYLNPKKIYHTIKLVKNWSVLSWGFSLLLDYLFKN